MNQKLIVMSMDALTYDDIEYLQQLPNFKKYFSNASKVESVRSIYPTITYPCHTTMRTGVWPEKHGIEGNLQLIPGQARLPWKWFQSWVKWDEDIFYAAKRNHLSTAAVFWPVTGCHPAIDYLIDEYWPQEGDTDIREIFRRAGSSEEVLDIIEEELHGCQIRTHPATDDFIIRCCRQIIHRFQPDLLFLHPGNVDAYRHTNGLMNERVRQGVDETDRYIGELMQTVEAEGLADCTNFVLTSDHGMLEIKRIVNVNVLLADAGLIDLDAEGNLISWKAFCQSGGTMGLVYLKDPDDKALYEKTEKVLQNLADEGVYGFHQVLTKEDCKKEHLDGDFSFALETDGYSAFGDKLVRPLVSDFDVGDYRYGRATHGHLPDKGLQPVFFAIGPGFEKNASIPRANLVDEAPTYAKLLGLTLHDADGRVLEELLHK